MRFRVVAITITFVLIIAIGAQKLVSIITSEISEEIPIQDASKPNKKGAGKKKFTPVVKQWENQDLIKTGETDQIVHMVQPTMCMTTPQQQKDLRNLGFDPCSTNPVSVR